MNRKPKRKTLTTKLNKRVEIQSKQKVPDSAGGHFESWKKKQVVWAALYPIKAVQKFEMKSVNVDATHHCEMRGYISILEIDQICFKGRKFEILVIENMQERNFNKFITCKERR